MEKIKSILSILTLFWAWLASIVIVTYVPWLYMPWVLALPISIGLACAITYGFILVFEKAK